jgi:hypothetical protein
VNASLRQTLGNRNNLNSRAPCTFRHFSFRMSMWQGLTSPQNVLTRSIYVRLGNPDTFSDHVKRISARWRLRKHRGFLRIEVGHCIMKTGNPENFPKMPGFLEEDASFCRSLLQHFGKQIIYNLFVCCRGPVETTSKPAGGAPYFQVQLLQTCPLTSAAALQFLRHSAGSTNGPQTSINMFCFRSRTS